MNCLLNDDWYYMFVRIETQRRGNFEIFLLHSKVREVLLEAVMDKVVSKMKRRHCLSIARIRSVILCLKEVIAPKLSLNQDLLLAELLQSQVVMKI